MTSEHWTTCQVYKGIPTTWIPDTKCYEFKPVIACVQVKERKLERSEVFSSVNIYFLDLDWA